MDATCLFMTLKGISFIFRFLLVSVRPPLNIGDCCHSRDVTSIPKYFQADLSPNFVRAKAENRFHCQRTTSLMTSKHDTMHHPANKLLFT